jgi:hypothetical protein
MTVNSKEQNFCPNYVQDFGLWFQSHHPLTQTTLRGRKCSIVEFSTLDYAELAVYTASKKSRKRKKLLAFQVQIPLHIYLLTALVM